MQFKHQSNDLFLTTGYGFDIRFYFMDGKLVEIEIDDIMCSPLDDCLHGIFVSVDGKPMSIYELSLLASQDRAEAVQEANQDADEWDAHCKSFSSQDRYL